MTRIRRRYTYFHDDYNRTVSSLFNVQTLAACLHCPVYYQVA
jgi:ribonuclease HIII